MEPVGLIKDRGVECYSHDYNEAFTQMASLQMPLHQVLPFKTPIRSKLFGQNKNVLFQKYHVKEAFFKFNCLNYRNQ